LQTGDTIVHGTVSFGSSVRSAPHYAAILVVVLVAHLAFMASPLHDRALAGAAYAVATSPPGARDAMTEIVQRERGDEHTGHCAIQWVSSVPSKVVGDAAGSGTMPTITGAAGAFLEWRPLAHALGPPLTEDPQALLQVFRL
jgi:hypothetical protein